MHVWRELFTSASCYWYHRL